MKKYIVLIVCALYAHSCYTSQPAQAAAPAAPKKEISDFELSCRVSGLQTLEKDFVALKDRMKRKGVPVPLPTFTVPSSTAAIDTEKEYQELHAYYSVLQTACPPTPPPATEDDPDEPAYPRYSYKKRGGCIPHPREMRITQLQWHIHNLKLSLLPAQQPLADKP